MSRTPQASKTANIFIDVNIFSFTNDSYRSYEQYVLLFPLVHLLLAKYAVPDLHQANKNQHETEVENKDIFLNIKYDQI